MEWTVKKRLVALIMTLFMGITAFAGCSLFEQNDEKYLNATVATIDYGSGKTDKISKRELLTAYNSYGYNYVQNGSTAQEAIDTTIDTIIDRKLTVKAVKDYYAKNGGEELNANEKTYLWDQTYSSMMSNLKTYFDKINNTPAVGEDESEKEASSSVFKQFESPVYLAYEDDKLVIMKDSIAERIRTDYEARKVNNKNVDFELEEDGAYPFKEALYNKLMSTTETGTEGAKVWLNAINNYVSDVRESYDYEKLDSTKDVLMFETDRVYDILKENYYVEKYADIYNGQKNSLKSNITVDELLKSYSKSVRESYTKYMLENGDFGADILSDVSKVKYIKDGSNYFYLSYIKFEVDTALLEDYKKQYEDGTLVGQEYETKVAEVYANAYAKVRDAKTGEETNQTVNATTLAEKISGELAKEYWTVERLNNGTAESLAEKQNALEFGMSDEQYVAHINQSIAYEKADAFRPYLYLYNADDSLKGAEYNAVFGADASGNILAGDTFADKQVVLDEIKTLYNGGDVKVGGLSKLVTVENDAVYLFFYAGEVENVFSGINEDFDISRNPEAIKTLASTRVNVFSEKTIFDQLYSQATKDKYSVFETLNMNYLRSLTEKIEIIENEIKDLY